MSPPAAAAPRPWGPGAWAGAAAAGTVALLGLDLLFLGVLARPFYDAALGPLRAPAVRWDAALLFYALYLGFVLAAAARPATRTREAAARGAALGLLAYGTYELTNLAVLAGWPARLVPVDIAWGVVLTAAVSAAAHAAGVALSPAPPPTHPATTSSP